MYALYEHATGYSLFRIKEFEEIASFHQEVEQSVQDLSRFQSVVQMLSFSPFDSAKNALENINAVSEGLLHADLRNFLEANLPKPGKKHSYTVGVQDARLGTSIQDELGMTCQHTGIVPEIFRGLRRHFSSFIKDLTAEDAGKAQLGLGHSYSRAKVKFNVNRVDNMIIQSISLLDQLDKDINTFSMRIREWYSYHFPELVKLVPDNYTYALVVRCVGERTSFDDENRMDELAEIVGNPATAQAIVTASKSSMGMEISPVDLINIQHFTNRVIALADYRKKLHEYLISRMHGVAPNLSVLIGELVGARLISHAGSLTNLAKYPASTVQILGAEKALFRALKTRGNTPKYGLIFHSTFIGRAAAANKGRISRYLANKCSIASRIDCFSDAQTDIFGSHLRQQVEDRLKYYTDGDIPKKNIEVMGEAMTEAKEQLTKKTKKEKKPKKSEPAIDDQSQPEEPVAMEIDDGVPPAKKKKKKSEVTAAAAPVAMEIEPTIKEEGGAKKKSKKKKSLAVESNIKEEAITPKSEKKKKKKSLPNGDVAVAPATTPLSPGSAKKKKRKSDAITTPVAMEIDSGVTEVTPKQGKKKKKSNVVEEGNVGGVVKEEETKLKKKKKRSVQ